MKNKTKAIVSAVLTAAMALSAIPFSVNASNTVYNRDSVEGLIPIEKDYHFLPGNTREGTDHHLLSENFTNADGTEFISLTKRRHELNINLNDGVTINEVQKAISELKSEEGYSYFAEKTLSRLFVGDEILEYECIINENRDYSCLCSSDGLTYAEVKEISKALKEKNLVKDMGFFDEIYTQREESTPYILTYDGDVRDTKGIYIDDKFEEYIEQNNLPLYISNDGPNDTHFEKHAAGSFFFIYPKEEMTLEEKFDIAEELWNEFDMAPAFCCKPEHFTDKYEEPIDLMEYEEGDANLDGTENMADAVFVMQSLANPNKYEITEQGSFNADIDSNGLTNADALAIQKAILKLS